MVIVVFFVLFFCFFFDAHYFLRCDFCVYVFEILGFLEMNSILYECSCRPVTVGAALFLRISQSDCLLLQGSPCCAAQI